MGLRKPGLGGDLPVSAAGRAELEREPDGAGLGLVESEDRGMAFADEPVGRPVATRDPEPGPLRSVPPDLLREFAAVLLGFLGLAHELAPVVGVATEEPLVGEQDDHAGWLEVVLDRDK